MWLQGKGQHVHRHLFYDTNNFNYWHTTTYNEKEIEDDKSSGKLTAVCRYYARSHLNCKFLTRFSKSACPDEYCSITSFTSYGFKASRNFFRAEKYLSFKEIGMHDSSLLIFACSFRFLVGWLVCFKVCHYTTFTHSIV